MLLKNLCILRKFRYSNDMSIDLHTHSTASDGDFAPVSLVDLAHQNGVSVLALTDHDTLSGNGLAYLRARELGMRFIPGIELSTNWGKTCIHVVGLNVDPENTALKNKCEEIAELRTMRAAKIAHRLEALGIPDTLENIHAKFPKVENISRAHFARILMARGVVKNEQQAFDRFLGTEGPAYVASPWPELEESLTLIKNAGGVAVLAHPMRYKFKSKLSLDALLEDFVKAGGAGIEVSSGSQSPAYSPVCEAMARNYHLYASCGSDFHRVGAERPYPGSEPVLPKELPFILDLIQ